MRQFSFSKMAEKRWAPRGRQDDGIEGCFRILNRLNVDDLLVQFSYMRPWMPRLVRYLCCWFHGGFTWVSVLVREILHMRLKLFLSRFADVQFANSAPSSDSRFAYRFISSLPRWRGLIPWGREHKCEIRRLRAIFVVSVFRSLSFLLTKNRYRIGFRPQLFWSPIIAYSTKY